MIRGKTCRPSRGDAQRVQPGQRRLAAHLHRLQLAHAGVAVDALVQPQDAVGHGEDRVLGAIALGVLADQKGRRLPAREMHRQAFQEALQLHAAVAASAGGAHRRCGTNPPPRRPG